MQAAGNDVLIRFSGSQSRFIINKMWFLLTRLYFFFAPPTMDTPETILMDPDVIQDTSSFYYMFKSWASQSTNPEAIIERFQITALRHLKIKKSPEHEYLVIETEDRKDDNKTRHFILERNTSSRKAPGATQNYEEDKLGETLDQIKRVATSAASTILGSELSSLEEGTVSSLSLFDESTLSVVHAADLVSDTFNITKKVAATDRFLGGNYVKNYKYHGQEVSYFVPENLSLFHFVTLAQVAHEAIPLYSLPKSQCYLYSGLVFAIAKVISSVSIDSSHLANKSGRLKKFKITDVRPRSPAIEIIFNLFNKRIESAAEEVI